MDIMLVEVVGLDMIFIIYDMNSNSLSILWIFNSSMLILKVEIFFF